MKKNSNRYIDILAKISFPVFFLHGYIIYLFRNIKKFFNITFDYPWAMFFVFVSTVIIVSILTAMLIEKMFPKHSVMLIGYGKKG